LSKSLAVLTTARKKNPATPGLWLAAIRAELRHGNKKEADALLAKALQECPTSGILWTASIEMVPCPQREGKSLDAIKRCDHDPHVLATVAKIFWHTGRLIKLGIGSAQLLLLLLILGILGHCSTNVNFSMEMQTLKRMF